MAKNYRLIPDESSNWEVATFLLIDHLHMPNTRLPNIKISRIDMHSSIKSLNFIEKLLGSVGYEVNKTLNNSISAAITRLEKKRYLNCDDGQCILTKEGLDRLEEIKSKYNEGNSVPVGKTKETIELFKRIPADKLKKLLKLRPSGSI